MTCMLLVLLACWLGLSVSRGVLEEDTLSQSTISGKKHTRPVLEIKALGETFSVGDFYDARTGLIMSGLSLWNKDTLEEHVEETPTVYSNIKVFQEEKTVDKSYMLDIDADIKLKFLFGLVKVSGSAKLIREQSSYSDVARVTLKYHATTTTKNLPLNTPQDNAKLCTLVNTKVGPTHVITSITYGLSSYIELQKSIQKSENKQKISGNLGIVMKALPNFNPDTSIDVDLDLDPLNKAYLKFSGDLVLPKMPATFKQAVDVFEEVNKAAQDSDTPVKYQVTPVEYFCEGATTIMHEISKTLKDLANLINTDLDDLAAQVKTMLRTDAAIRFASIRNELTVFQAGLRAYSAVTKMNIAAKIISVISGESVENELLQQIEKHMEGVWNKMEADEFLDHRTREITTIELVTEAAQHHPELQLSDAGAAMDNKCIFNHKHATVYDLYVLPTANIAKMFLKAAFNKRDNEEDRWYNDLSVVNKVGTVFHEFLTYAKNNFDSDHCFLVRLNELSKKKSEFATITMYKNGAVYEGNFVPPSPPPASACQASKYSSLALVLGQNTATEKSRVTGLEVMATWKKAKTAPTGGDAPIEYEYFPTTFQMDDVSQFAISDLKPNTEYDIKVRYKVGGTAGNGPWSPSVNCKTASTSAPVLPQIATQTTDSVTVIWEPPQQNLVDDLTYNVVAEVEAGGDVLRKRVETQELRAELNDLKAGLVYHVTITPLHNGVSNEAVSVEVPTLPYPPDTPSITQTDTYWAKVLVTFNNVRLGPGFSVHSLEFKYHKINEEFMGPVEATEQRDSVLISSLSQWDHVIRGMESGVSYQITCALRLMVGGKLITTDYSHALVITTKSDSPVDDDKLRKEISDYAKTSAAKIDPLVDNSDALHAQAKQLNDEIEDNFAKLQDEIAGVGTVEVDGLSSGVMRGKCVRRGVKYHVEEDTETHFPDAQSEFECLHYCSQTFTDTLSITYVGSGNYSSPVGSKCYCFSKRHGVPTEVDPQAVSIDRDCWDVAGATTDQYRSCVQYNWDFISQDIVSEEGQVATSMYDCAQMCTETSRNINLALGQTASQSGSSSNPASNAVDGVTGIDTGYARADSQNNVASWTVTLAQKEYIDSVVVYNKLDNSQWRLDGAEVVVDGESVGIIRVNEGMLRNTVPVGLVGQEVKVQKTGGSYLTLVEVEVYGGDCVGVVYEPSSGVCQMKGTEKSDKVFTFDMGKSGMYTSCLMHIGAFGTVPS